MVTTPKSKTAHGASYSPTRPRDLRRGRAQRMRSTVRRRGRRRDRRGARRLVAMWVLIRMRARQRRLVGRPRVGIKKARVQGRGREGGRGRWMRILGERGRRRRSEDSNCVRIVEGIGATCTYSEASDSLLDKQGQIGYYLHQMKESG